MGDELTVTGNTSFTTPSATNREKRGYDLDAHLIVEGEYGLGGGWVLSHISDYRLGPRATASQPAPFKDPDDPEKQQFDVTQFFNTFKKGDWSLSFGRRYATVYDSEPVHEHHSVTHSHIYKVLQPLTVTVLTLGYKDCHVGVFPGWDAVYNKESPSLVASFTTHAFLLGGCAFKPFSTAELTVVGTADRESPPDEKKRYYVNAFGKWQPSPSFYLGADLLHGGRENGSSWDEWSGVALYADLVPLFSKDGRKKDLEWATRFERDWDKKGHRFGSPADIVSLSTAVTVRLFGALGVDLFLRGEVRRDEDLDGNRLFQGTARNDQFWLQLFAAYMARTTKKD